MDSELLVGFDARESWLKFDDTWPPERKENFLLRQDIEKPLSTDVMVWDSVFHLESAIGLPAWVGPVQWLWDNLQRMEAWLTDSYIKGRKPYQVIGITRLVSSATKPKMQSDYQIVPSELDESWKLLGYDVSDRFLLSGLSNCGYSSDTIVSLREALRKRWAVHLNKYHLFAERDRASEFKNFADDEVKEHAPFFVYGLYLIHDVKDDDSN